MVNIAKLLKDCPKGTKLYSPLFGEVEFDKITKHVYGDIRIHVITNNGDYCFSHYGQPYSYPSAECLLFPSKDHRTWEDWEASKPHYDIANFRAGMPVLVRDDNEEDWVYGIFSHYCKNMNQFVVCCFDWRQCIPYEGNEHLLGTTDMPDECYVNW